MMIGFGGNSQREVSKELVHRLLSLFTRPMMHRRELTACFDQFWRGPESNMSDGSRDNLGMIFWPMWDVSGTCSDRFCKIPIFNRIFASSC